MLAPVNQNTIPACFSKSKKARVDAAVARFSYATGTAFHALTDPTFADMLREVGAYGASYKSPNVNQLREELLDKEKASLDQEIRQSFFDKLRQNGTTIASDGCADTCSRPLINNMAINNKGAMFLNCVDAKSETKVGCCSMKTLQLTCACTGTRKVATHLLASARQICNLHC